MLTFLFVPERVTAPIKTLTELLVSLNLCSRQTLSTSLPSCTPSLLHFLPAIRHSDHMRPISPISPILPIPSASALTQHASRLTSHVFCWNDSARALS